MNARRVDPLAGGVWESADVMAVRRFFGLTRKANQQDLSVAFKRAIHRLARVNADPNVATKLLARNVEIILWCTNWIGPRGGYTS